MENLSAHNELVIQQKKEWGEILTGFETKNKYAIKTPDGQELYFAAEIAGSVLLRMFLKALRPFTIHIVDAQGKRELRLERPFRFFFHQLNIYDAQDRHIGCVKRQFSILRRLYSVLDETGSEIFQLLGPMLHPWTFNIKSQGVEIGKIVKRWSGLVKESFTDADNFTVSLSSEMLVTQKAILLGAVFLIDFVHFENRSN